MSQDRRRNEWINEICMTFPTHRLFHYKELVRFFFAMEMQRFYNQVGKKLYITLTKLLLQKL